MDLAARVDGPHTPLQHLNFGMTELPIQGVQLTVDVADADVVQVNQSQSTDPRARERFDGPRTHAAHAHHAHMGLAHVLQTGASKQAPDATKAGLKLLFLKIHRPVGYASGSPLPS